MSNFLQIRKRLAFTQSALAKELGVSQANISHYEHGQDLPPEAARKLIKIAHSRGVSVSFDDIYRPLTP